MPARVAGHAPRSVQRRVTSAAGVTSNAGLSARAPSGVTSTSTTRPPGRRPSTQVTSRGSRASIGMSRTPSSRRGSIVEEGTATKNGTPWAFAASAFR